MEAKLTKLIKPIKLIQLYTGSNSCPGIAFNRGDMT